MQAFFCIFVKKYSPACFAPLPAKKQDVNLGKVYQRMDVAK
jgi:hypothetical protein